MSILYVRWGSTKFRTWNCPLRKPPGSWPFRLLISNLASEKSLLLPDKKFPLKPISLKARIRSGLFCFSSVVHVTPNSVQLLKIQFTNVIKFLKKTRIYYENLGAKKNVISLIKIYQGFVNYYTIKNTDSVYYYLNQIKLILPFCKKPTVKEVTFALNEGSQF